MRYKFRWSGHGVLSDGMMKPFVEVGKRSEQVFDAPSEISVVWMDFKRCFRLLGWDLKFDCERVYAVLECGGVGLSSFVMFLIP